MRLAFAAFLLLAPACMLEGERARTGDCPPGETCSPTTPDGLLFDGAALGDVLFDSGIHPTAVGGSQRIVVAWAPSGALFDLPFTATTDGAAFQVSGSGPGGVDLRATAAGGDRLRIVDRDGLLYDRVGIAAGVVDRVGLQVHVFEGSGLADQPVALWHDSPTQLVVALRGASQGRLVDTSMTIGLGTAGRAVGWDSFIVEPQPTGATVTVTAVLGDGQTFAMPLRVFDAADELVVQELPAGGFTAGDVVCFTARAEGLVLVRAPYSFSVTGPATITPLGDLARNCIQVATVTGTGLVTLTAAVGARTVTVSLPGMPSARTTPVPFDLRGPTPGERAQAVAAAE